MRMAERIGRKRAGVYYQGFFRPDPKPPKVHGLYYVIGVIFIILILLGAYHG